MSNLFIEDLPLMVLPKLAIKIGLNEAMVIQQIHYWLIKSRHEINGKRWCYNSMNEWREQFPFWSMTTVKDIFSKLEKSGFLVVDFFNKSKFDRTKWYTINYELFGMKEIRPLDKSESDQSDKSDSDQCNGRNPTNVPCTEINSENIAEGEYEGDFSSKTKTKKKSGAVTRSTPYPSGFVVTDEMRVWAKQLGVKQVDSETEHWRDYHESKGSTFKSWPAAWRTWMRNSVKFGKGKGGDDGMSRFDKAKSQWEGLV